jgi:hypothetical protein
MINENASVRINRENIYIVGRHCNLIEEAAQRLLEKNIFNDAGSWKKFLHLFFIVLICLCAVTVIANSAVSGISGIIDDYFAEFPVQLQNRFCYRYPFVRLACRSVLF